MVPDDEQLPESAPQLSENPNLFDALLNRRDEQRRARRRIVVKGRELPWELNRHGIMRWYLHPQIEDTAHQSCLIYEQAIPVGSRSGRQKHQGGAVIFVVNGQGHTVIDGETYSWRRGDCLQLPTREEGVTFQHFNDDEIEVRFLYVEANLVEALGVDRGAGFEQLMDAPEFDE